MERPHEINSKNKHCWQELINIVNRDPWHLRSPCSMNAIKMKEIVKTLFSTHPNRTNTVDERGSTKECPFFTVKELDKGQKNARTVWYSQRNAETAI